jgi:hypothetical protein
LTLCLIFVIPSATGRSSRVWASDRISGGFSRSQLAPLQLSALHRPIMRMRFFVVVAAGPTEKEKDRLTVFSHDRLLYDTFFENGLILTAIERGWNLDAVGSEFGKICGGLTTSVP